MSNKPNLCQTAFLKPESETIALMDLFQFLPLRFCLFVHLQMTFQPFRRANTLNQAGLPETKLVAES